MGREHERTPNPLGIVFSSFTTSLDGFIADANGQVGHLFDWYNDGEVEVPLRGYGLTFHMSPASAEYWHQNDTEGAFIAGRGIFDDAGGWGGNHPAAHRRSSSPTVHRRNAGFVDELAIDLAPVTFGGGTPLFGGLDTQRVGLDIVESIHSPLVTHLRFAVRRRGGSTA